MEPPSCDLLYFCRPPLDGREPFRAPNPNSWPSSQNVGPPSHVGNQGFANQFLPRPPNNAVPSNPVSKRALYCCPMNSIIFMSLNYVCLYLGVVMSFHSLCLCV